MKKLIDRFRNWLDLSEKTFQYVLAGLLISLLIRAILIHYLLPYYSIDENEVVESALSFIVGDLDPRFYKYGFFTSYVLAVIYYLYAFIVSLFSSDYFSTNQVLYDVFFVRYDFYYMARFLQIIFNLMIAVFSYKIALKLFNKKAAFFTLIILLFPIEEFHLAYTVRVDDTLALFFVLTSYVYLLFIETEEKRYLNLIFIFLACAFASKPMPALFSFGVLIYPFIRSEEKGKFIGRFLLFFLGTSLIVNPYFVLKMKEFYQYNYQSLVGFQVGSKEMKSYAKGFELFWANKYGLSFKIILALSFFYYAISAIIAARSKKWMMLHFLIIPLSYFLCFTIFNTRYYWFIALIPYIIIMIAYLWDSFSKRFPTIPYFSYILALLLMFSILFKVVQSNVSILDDVLTKDVAMSVFEEEFRKIVPKGSRVLLIGSQSRSPLLFNRDLNKEAQRGQYFMYERIRNEGYKKFFVEAHRYWVKNHDSYHMFTLDQIYYDYYKGKKLEKLVYQDLLNYAIKNKIQYIVLSYANREHKSVWEEDQRLRKLTSTWDYKNVYGLNAKLYRVGL